VTPCSLVDESYMRIVQTVIFWMVTPCSLVDESYVSQFPP